MMNSITIDGNVGRAEMKTVGGQKLLKGSIAHTEWNPKNKTEVTHWVNFSVWGDKAERLEPILTKGAFAILHGRLRTFSYEGKNGKVNGFEVNVFEAAAVQRKGLAEERAPAGREDDGDLPF